MLAFDYLSEATSGLGPSLRDGGRRAEEAARTAIDLDPRGSIAHAMLAWTLCHLGDRGLALEESNNAIALNANDPWGYISKGLYLMVSGHPAEARKPLANSLRLDPLGPTALLARHLRAQSYFFERNYSAAETTARRLIREYPEFSRPRITLAASLGQLGREEEARVALDAAIATSLPILRFMTTKGQSHWRPEDLEHLLDGLRKAGWTG
jgi:adenylate cyclase